MQALISGHAQGLRALWQGAVSREEKTCWSRNAFETLRVPTASGQIEQLKGDSKSAK
jgi:hypothetical protein